MTAPSAPEPRSVPRNQRALPARRWWQRLPPGRAGLPEPLLFDRGSRARLRRAHGPVDILDEPVVFALHRELGFGPQEADRTLIPVAVAACVLARIRTDAPGRGLASVLGRTRDGPQALLSPLRLKRLLTARDPDDLLRQMRRAVDLAGDRPVDVGGLAVTVLDWLDPDAGDRARSRFAYDYYAAEHATPGRPADAASEAVSPAV
ncbi:MAG: type I-E CRISPR-associated protein Cse2/CasB [Methylobacterium frigidaeris]